MGEHEWRRVKPQLWAMFAAAAAMDVRTMASVAANKADALLSEFEHRFPIEKEDD